MIKEKLKTLKKYLPLAMLILMVFIPCYLGGKHISRDFFIPFDVMPIGLYTPFRAFFDLYNVVPLNVENYAFLRRNIVTGLIVFNFDKYDIATQSFVLNWNEVRIFANYIVITTFDLFFIISSVCLALGNRKRGFVNASWTISTVYISYWMYDLFRYEIPTCFNHISLTNALIYKLQLYAYVVPFTVLSIIGIGLSLFFFGRALWKRIQYYTKKGK